jgi:hypothetical protein
MMRTTCCPDFCRPPQRDLEFHSRNLRRVALFTLIFFTLNILISGLLLFLPQADITYGIG